jgi:hypothetical protein
MSKYEEADLILKLYEMRREPTMRIARDWFFLEFNPETIADVDATMFSEHSGHLRMVMTYWDMAAALVNHGAIPIDLFNETNGEHFSVFAKLEPILADARTAFAPQFLMNLEKLIDATKDGRERVAAIRERMKAIQAQVASAKAKSQVA